MSGRQSKNDVTNAYNLALHLLNDMATQFVLLRSLAQWEHVNCTGIQEHLLNELKDNMVLLNISESVQTKVMEWYTSFTEVGLSHSLTSVELGDKYISLKSSIFELLDHLRG